MVVDTSGTWVILSTSTWTQIQQQFQMYQIAAVILLFVIIGIAVLFKDAYPFFWARFVSHEVVVGIMDNQTRHIVPNRDFKKHKGMFYYKGEPLPYVKVYPGNFRFTGLSFDILDVELSVLNDPRYKKACKELKDHGYPNINAVEKAVWFSQITDPNDIRLQELITREGYVDYDDAKKKINPADLTVDSKIVKQFFTAIPLSELIGYGTHVPSEDILGEVDDVYEARKPSMRMQRDLSKVIPIILVIFVVSVAAVVIYKVFFAK